MTKNKQAEFDLPMKQVLTSIQFRRPSKLAGNYLGGVLTSGLYGYNIVGKGVEMTTKEFVKEINRTQEAKDKVMAEVKKEYDLLMADIEKWEKEG